MYSLDGKVALVTGAAGGLGAATARLLAEAGATVVIADINRTGAEEVATEINAAGGAAFGHCVDVSEEDDVRRLMDEIGQSFGQLDVLDNNAALVGAGNQDLDVATMDVAVWDRMFAINVRGPMLMTKHALPLMIQGGGGSIINIASSAAGWGDARSTAYGTSKAAIVGFTRYVAMQYLHDNVRCNAISPGMIGSETAKEIWDQSGLTETVAVRLLRFGEPLDIARGVLFLASEQSDFMTGQLLKVDGGFSAGSPIYPERRAALMELRASE